MTPTHSTAGGRAHTPGPWVIDNRRVGEAIGDIVAECPNVSGAEVVRAPMTSDRQMLTTEIMAEEARANACLISASPQLLQTMQKVRDYFLYETDFSANHPLVSEIDAALSCAGFIS